MEGLGLGTVLYAAQQAFQLFLRGEVREKGRGGGSCDSLSLFPARVRRSDRGAARAIFD